MNISMPANLCGKTYAQLDTLQWQHLQSEEAQEPDRLRLSALVKPQPRSAVNEAKLRRVRSSLQTWLVLDGDKWDMAFMRNTLGDMSVADRVRCLSQVRRR